MMKTTQFRRFRLNYHITLGELAIRIGKSNQYLSALEQGKIQASSEQQKKIADVFIQLAAERSKALRLLDNELAMAKDHLFEPVEVKRDEP